MKSGLNAMIRMLTSYEDSGKRVMSNGTVLYGKAPHVGEEAWLHGVFSSCPHSGLDEIEQKTGKSLPAILRKFLLAANGLEIFSGTLSLYGWRENCSRTVEDVLSQPYSIITPQVEERPRWLPEDCWILGSYDWDGTVVCLDGRNSVTARCVDSGDAVCEWKTLNAFLQGEAKRLPELFDDFGVPLDDDASTLPGDS